MPTSGLLCRFAHTAALNMRSSFARHAAKRASVLSLRFSAAHPPSPPRSACLHSKPFIGPTQMTHRSMHCRAALPQMMPRCLWETHARLASRHVCGIDARCIGLLANCQSVPGHPALSTVHERASAATRRDVRRHRTCHSRWRCVPCMFGSTSASW